MANPKEVEPSDLDNHSRLIYATFSSISGSFEIFVIAAGTQKKVQIWTGVNKGPPRKNKFPEAADLVDAVNSAIQD